MEGGLISMSTRRKIDEQTFVFLNLLENFSKTEDDLVNIFDKANQYMNAPLKSYVDQFVLDCRLKGNVDEAFEKLSKKIKGTKLCDILENLKICSEHDSNYEIVIKDSKKSFKEYMRSLSIQDAIRNSAKVDMAALMLALVIIIQILNSFLSESVVSIMVSSYIGIGIIGYFVMVVGISVYMLFIKT